MHRCFMDHLTVTASSLQAGVEYVRRALGVTAEPGGAHPRMGTHNCLLKLGDRLFLEIIAVDPAARHPGRARWFQLDRPDPSRPVRLAAWVARTDNIRVAASASPVPLGPVEPISRGGLHWSITVPEDGALPLEGIVPALIEWPDGVHPAAALADRGCHIDRLEGFHPDPALVNRVLAAIGYEGEFHVFPTAPGQPSSLVAHVRTPAGMRRLGSPGGPSESP